MTTNRAVPQSALSDFFGRLKADEVANLFLSASALTAVTISLSVSSANEFFRLILALEITGKLFSAKALALFFFIRHYVLVFAVPQEINVFVNALSLAKIIVDLAVVCTPVHQSSAEARAIGLTGKDLSFSSAFSLTSAFFLALAIEELYKGGIFALSTALVNVEQSV